MPKVDPETGEPMSDDPEGPEDLAGGKTTDPKDAPNPDSSNASGGGS